MGRALPPDTDLRVGVDLGGTTISAVLIRQADVLVFKEVRTDPSRAPSVVLNQIVSLINDLLHSAGMTIGSVKNIGLGLPGEVDPVEGVFRASPILPTWKDVPVVNTLREVLGRSVSIENDANAAILGEFAYGAGRGADPLMLLTIGTGVGGAIIEGGRLFRGRVGSAGEVGHVSVDPTGPVCWCGGKGCLGLLGSTTALVRYYRELARIPETKSIDGEVVAEAWRSSSVPAQIAVDRVAVALASGIATSACVLAPQRVVLAGGVLGGLESPILERIRIQLRERTYPQALAELDVVSAALGARAGAIGASLLPNLQEP